MSKQEKCKFCCTTFILSKFRPNQQYCSPKCRAIDLKESISKYKKQWAKTNKEKVRFSQKKWLENNQEQYKKICYSYRQANKPKLASYFSLRRRKVRRAQPVWANTSDILAVYKEAQYFGLEVDHIIPLQHPDVCGLHVWDNLQLLSKSENARKSNKFIMEIV